MTALSRRPLTDGWRVHAASGPTRIGHEPIPGTVPGVVHLDLLAAGLIPDPYLDDNESLLAWIGLVDWTYRTTLTMTERDLRSATRHELVFDGLDTVATITMGGRVVGEVANQHRSYRFDVTDVLEAGDNELVVAFRSPVRHANAQSVALGARPGAYPAPYQAIRKSACSFGWDWGIATCTSGIWRPVRLESWSGARLARVDVRAEAAGAGGVVRLHAEIARSGEDAVTLAIEVGGEAAEVEVPAGADTAELEVHLAEAARWWPAGYGDAALHDVEVSLRMDGVVLDAASRRVGFRSLRWDTAPDAEGTPFTLFVNDRRVYVKGVNWIPDDAFPSRVGRDRYRTRLQQAKDANLNLIRVWGGGIYESEDFYDIADELGLLVWQDFLFACAAYAEEEPLRTEVEQESRENISRLAHRASLSLLTGNNENSWGYEDWGWKERLDGRTWGAHYYYELFPALISELAPGIPYAPGSPFSPGGGWDGREQTGPHPNDESRGTMHLWEQWNRRDWSTYRDHRPRFAAEFGWQGPPTWTTLTDAISDDPLTPDSPGMIVHQKAIDGNAKLAGGLVGHYRVPDDIGTWHWAMQLNQANAVTCALEWFRSLDPHNSGAVVWQLNDCWPVTSWAAIDGAGREKPLYFALRNAFAPRSVSVQPSGDALVAVLVNDTDESWEGEVVMRRVTFGGEVRDEHVVRADAGARSVVRVEVPSGAGDPGDAAREVLVVEALGTRGLWWYAEPRDSALVDAALTAAVAEVGPAAFDVAITAHTLVRDLTLLVDRIAPGASVDRGLITLLAGEKATFRISGVPDGLTADAVLRPEVARSGNQLVH